ncbi:MAG: tetratricopeptide repeat protein, partial [Isosphaeraceae bacterium]
DDLKDDEASSRAYREAIAAKPDYAEAYCNLGLAEYRLGSFRQALADLERGIDLIPEADPKRPTWLQLAGLARSLAALEPRLEESLAGGPSPTDASETVGFARLCAWKNRQLHARAARHYADAFQADPKLADDLIVGDRYNAAGSAILAGLGQGRDAGSLDPERRAALRAMGLDWLRADLALRARIIEGSDAAAAERSRALLRYWMREPNFAGVREPEALAALPQTERELWQALWADLEKLASTPSP